MSKADPFINALLGKRVTQAWSGYGSALFVEFGKFTPLEIRKGEPINHLTGKLTLMIEWSWRIEGRQSILGGSWSSQTGWPALFKRLIGCEVIGVEIFGPLPEIAVSLSNGLRVVSFMTAKGQPEWAIIARQPQLGHLCVKKGKLHVEIPRS